MRLAVDGGRPVRSRLLPYGRQSIGEDDVAAVAEVLRSEWLTTGPAVERFERAFAEVTGGGEAVAVNSGTAALHAALHAVGVRQGDEVIVPPITFAATANAVLYCAGTPVFADVEPDTLLLDPAAVRARLTSRTRAVVAVDYTGHPCDYAALRAAAGPGTAIVADACHALGARFDGTPAGALADVSTFSLHPVKHLTTGEGGVITTADPELARRLRVFRNHGITSDHRERERTGAWAYDMVELGYNYRLSDVQCALGTSQLRKLAGWVERRRGIAARYGEAFGRLDGVETPVVRPGCEPAWHLYVIRLRLERLRADRAEIYRALRAENIGVNVHYRPVPWHPYYQRLGYGTGHWPVAERAYERILTLPLWPGMSDGDVEDVMAAVEKVVGHYLV
jgi:perosamine synthetase